jgi:hypothetical protein
MRICFDRSILHTYPIFDVVGHGVGISPKALCLGGLVQGLQAVIETRDGVLGTEEMNSMDEFVKHNIFMGVSAVLISPL